MASATFAAFAALSAAFTAIELFPFLELQSRAGTSTPTQPSTFDSMVQIMLPLAATVALSTAVAVIHLHHAVPAAAVGAGNKRLSELVPFILCTTAGILEFFFFVQSVGVVDDGVSALARALGRAAVDALPASATLVFFLGITLVIAHIRDGGEGGGGAAVADIRRVPVPVDLLKRITLGAAAALFTLMAMALYHK